MSLSNWIDQRLIMAFDSWQMMHWLTVGLMLIVVLVIYTCTHAWRMMPHQVPLISLDWLGCILVSACMLEVIWLFTYGEYYNWTDCSLWLTVLCLLPLTILVTIGRLTHIRHPYIEPWIFRRNRLYPILAMFFVAELMNATPHALPARHGAPPFARAQSGRRSRPSAWECRCAADNEENTVHIGCNDWPVAVGERYGHTL